MEIIWSLKVEIRQNKWLTYGCEVRDGDFWKDIWVSILSILLPKYRYYIDTYFLRYFPSLDWSSLPIDNINDRASRVTNNRWWQCCQFVMLKMCNMMHSVTVQRYRCQLHHFLYICSGVTASWTFFLWFDPFHTTDSIHPIIWYVDRRDYKYHFAQFICNRGGGRTLKRKMFTDWELSMTWLVILAWYDNTVTYNMIQNVAIVSKKYIKIKNIAWNLLQLNPKWELLMNFSSWSFLFFFCAM